MPGAQKGKIPILYSMAFIIGFVGMAVTLVWAIVSVGWWAGVVVFGLYTLTGFVRSSLSRRRV